MCLATARARANRCKKQRPFTLFTISGDFTRTIPSPAPSYTHYTTSGALQPDGEHASYGSAGARVDGGEWLQGSNAVGINLR